MPSAANQSLDYTALDKSELVALLQQMEQQVEQQDQAREETIRQQNKLLKQRDQLIRAQQRHIDKIEAYLNLAKVQRFGSSSEKMPCQVDLFDEAELEVALSELEAELPDEVVERVKRKAPSRGFSDKLPRVRVEHRLSDDEKAGAKRTFFVKTKEELDIVPARARVLEHFQEKAVFEDAEGEQIKVAQRPVHPLGKCMASLTLLAYIVVAKYADGRVPRARPP